MPEDVLLEFQDVNFTYPRHQTQPLLSRLNYTVRAGARIGVAGPSGIGKTTLVGLVTGRLQPSSGSIRLAAPIDFRRGGHFGLVAQGEGLYPWRTIQENLTLPFDQKPKPETYASIVSQLPQLGLSADILPLYPRSLSFGMRKRVEILRALVKPAALFVADEPFASLDVGSTELAKNWINATLAQNNSALILVSHDLYSIVSLCDEILVFAKGSMGRVSVLQNKAKGLSADTRGASSMRLRLAESIGVV
jgi:ABC-type nitrate/sulfonate/bicarbonate transport system ATPase subunit